MLTLSGYPEVMAALPMYTVREQMDLLLRVIEARERHFGSEVQVDTWHDAALVAARERPDIDFLLAGLEDSGWIQQFKVMRGPDRPRSTKLLPRGHLRLGELAKTVVLSDRVFVAMSFDPSMTVAYDQGFRAAIAGAGYTPFRIDRSLKTGERIDARIMVEIRRSRAVVADATGDRSSVFYEAGYAEGLGRPVIWTVRGSPDQLPFDTRQFPHLVWQDEVDLALTLGPIIELRLGSRRSSGGQG